MAVMIGKVIHELVKQSGLKAKVVAEYINVSESTLFGIYKRESVDIDKLNLFSRLLNKNLFLYYLNEEPLKSMFSKDMIALQNRILELETEVNIKGEKLKDLTDMIEMQKKVISLHEANSSNERLKTKRKK
jgi:transcriptional regulator with XRE-family HTH domain